MVWEQKSTVIINLTCLMEDTVSLCHRYWPESGSDLYHIYEVSSSISWFERLIYIYYKNRTRSTQSQRINIKAEQIKRMC